MQTPCSVGEEAQRRRNPEFHPMSCIPYQATDSLVFSGMSRSQSTRMVPGPLPPK